MTRSTPTEADQVSSTVDALAHEPIEKDNGEAYDGYEQWVVCSCGWPGDEGGQPGTETWWKHRCTAAADAGYVLVRAEAMEALAQVVAEYGSKGRYGISHTEGRLLDAARAALAPKEAAMTDPTVDALQVLSQSTPCQRRMPWHGGDCGESKSAPIHRLGFVAVRYDAQGHEYVAVDRRRAGRRQGDAR